MNLDLKRDKYAIVIGANYVKNYFEKIQMITSIGCNYFTILHDKDYNDEGELKNPHYHLLVQLKVRTRAKTILNRICDILGCDSVNVQIEEVHDFISCIQYLVHKNDTNKFQYEVKDIQSNLDYETISAYMRSCVNEEITAELLITYIQSGISRLDLLRRIGIGKFNLYYRTIEMIYNEIRVVNEIEES